jgi:hypothetical protein
MERSTVFPQKECACLRYGAIRKPVMYLLDTPATVSPTITARHYRYWRRTRFRDFPNRIFVATVVGKIEIVDVAVEVQNLIEGI